MSVQPLTFSKKHRPQPEGVALHTVVVHTLKLLRGIFPPGTATEAKLADAGTTVRGDETQLKQPLMNLCLNAKDAMPKGGKLLVQTAGIPSNNHPAPTPTTLEPPT